MCARNDRACVPDAMIAARPRSATLIVNARSRTGADAFAQAQDLLKAAGVEILAAHALEDPGKLEQIVKAAIATDAEMLVVGGGDGSISSVVDFLVGTDVVLGLLPLGTANSFARSLGLPLGLAEAVEVIATGRPTKVDLGMIDDDYFANCAAIGLAPLIAETVPHWLKRWFGRVGYLTWAGVSLARFKPFTLIVDGERVAALEVRIANGSFQGGTELVDAADPRSGEIIVQAVIGATRARLLRSWGASLLRHDDRHLTTRDFRGTSLRIETEPPLPISIDGEIAAHTPITAHIAPRSISVMLPA